ncbi:E3 ubiquitin-protein ligase MARCH7 isoform X2 [Lampris incognitus]|uniref:E3 ubiquitin-protein ligase MARCH7 isoform X2 n=1 Tax=Lampris incognitus TaxID=2546036 RepID=UPI0024B4ED65|nr:E3 ubiquitin-protein ligase MARCH7 isoform X2 [Lampris incognitus]
MDSRSGRPPFSMSSSRSSYTSTSSYTSSSLGASRLYGRERVLSSDFFPRASTVKSEADYQSYPYRSSPREDASSDSRSSSWRLPSPLTTSSRSYDRPWADSPLSGRSKLNDSERRLGTYSGLNATDDGDSKRAKLSFGNRGAYSKTPSTTVNGSSYSGSRLSGGTGVGEKRTDTWLDSSWRSCRLLSRSSSSTAGSLEPESLLSRRKLETRHEPSPSGQGESRIRSPGLASALYQPGRLTSTYAQGARPKDTLYSSFSSAPSSSRESSVNGLVSSASTTSHYQSSQSARELGIRTTTAHSRTVSSQESPKSTSAISSSSSRFVSPMPRQDTNRLPPQAVSEQPLLRQIPEEPEGRRSTRRLLSRLFSRRSSHDSSSGSSSVQQSSIGSTFESQPATGEAANNEEGARISSVEPDTRGSEAVQGLAHLGPHRGELPILEDGQGESQPSALIQPSQDSRRLLSSNSNSRSAGRSSSNWLSSSLRNRYTPFFSRHVRDESSPPATGLIDGCLRHLRRQDDPNYKASDDSEDEDDEVLESVEVPGPSGPGIIRVQPMQPNATEIGIAVLPTPRGRLYEDIVAVDSEIPEEKKPVPSRDPERLCKIQESLLLEDSDEEEGDLCRICQMGEESASNPLIEPCRCTGSLQYVHQECIKKWLHSKISSGTSLESITKCELCKEKLHLNIDNFDVNELYRTHMQSDYEFISSGLYLVVLLHLCEQRFSDVLGAANEAGVLVRKGLRRKAGGTTGHLSTSLTWRKTLRRIGHERTGG